MAGLKFKIHPLFFIFGVYFAATGKIFIFLIYSITALIHEMGHIYQAERLGYKMNKVTLLPYGAVMDGSISGLKFKDETLLALSGPLVNILVALIFTAAWWVYPDIYAFTDVVVTANITIALVNFIPAYPLDGGRILFSALAAKLSEKKAENIIKMLGFLFFSALLALFIYSLFLKVNYSLLFFAAFVLVGLFTKPRQNSYIRIFNLSNDRLTRGMAVKKYAVSKHTTIKKIISIIDSDSFVEIVVMDGGGKILAKFDQKQLNSIIERGSIYDTMEKFLE